MQYLSVETKEWGDCRTLCHIRCVTQFRRDGKRRYPSIGSCPVRERERVDTVNTVREIVTSKVWVKYELVGPYV